MNEVRQIIADLVAAGVDPMLIGRVAEAIASAAKPAVTEDDTLERRRAWDRDYRRKKRMSGGKSGGQEVDAASVLSGGNPPDIHPTNADLARVRDINPYSENNLSAVDDDVDARIVHSDDWPKGEVAKALVEAVGSPWLDPAKTPGLTTTAGIIGSWKRAGASWEHDVVPVIRGVAAKSRKPIQSWRFFSEAVAQQVADNRQALAIPDARVVPLRGGQGPPVSYSERSTASWDEAMRRIAEDG